MKKLVIALLLLGILIVMPVAILLTVGILEWQKTLLIVVMAISWGSLSGLGLMAIGFFRWLGSVSQKNVRLRRSALRQMKIGLIILLAGTLPPFVAVLLMKGL